MMVQNQFTSAVSEPRISSEIVLFNPASNRFDQAGTPLRCYRCLAVFVRGRVFLRTDLGGPRDEANKPERTRPRDPPD
jgi:hypothetical protein